MCGQNEFSGHLYGMLDRDQRTTVTAVRSNNYQISDKYQFVPCDIVKRNQINSSSFNTPCNYCDNSHTNPQCRYNSSRRIHNIRCTFNLNKCLKSKFNESLLVFICFWILTIQTTNAKPMASLYMTRPVIKGRSQLISDQANTAYSQVKIYFSNYLDETWGMSLPQIEEAFGHRFDKLFHPNGGEQIQKKYLQKLPQEAADRVKLMAMEFNKEFIENLLIDSDNILQRLIASFQKCYENYDQRNELAQEFLNSIQNIKTVRNEIWSCMDNVGIPHQLIETIHSDIIPKKDDWVAETALFVHVLNQLEYIQEVFEIIKNYVEI